MPKVAKIVPVAPTGVGRVDYSANIERVTEPVTRSWQKDYLQEDTAVAMGPGEVRTIPVTLPATDVALLNDFRCSSPINCLIKMQVQEQLAGIWYDIYHSYGYALISDQLQKGFAVEGLYRIIITNFSDKTIDIEYSVSGIYASKQQYCLQVIPP